MNQLQRDFLRGGFALFHCDLSIDDVYDKEDIYSSKSEFRKMIDGCNKLYEDNQVLHSIHLSQFNYQRNDILIIVAKLLRRVEVKQNGIIKTINANESKIKKNSNLGFVILEIDYTKKVEKISLFFEMDIIDSITFDVDVELAEEIIEPEVIPEITTSFSLGESLVNIKFKELQFEYDELIIKLFDSQNDLMGTFKPKEGMNYLSITDLAFEKYTYQIITTKNGKITGESKLVSFELRRPNYSGRPTR